MGEAQEPSPPAGVGVDSGEQWQPLALGQLVTVWPVVLV